MNKVEVKKILSSVNKKNEKELRIILYGVSVELIFSIELFPSNYDLKGFTKKLNLEFRDYVFKARPIVVSRITSIVRKMNHDELLDMYKTYKEIIFSDVQEYKSSKNEKRSKIDDILNQFGE
ncbi:hypothetical protein PWJ44_002791 [Listeria monocytogenes]|nr:hypothetical protein [Listeria monocytogenes]EKN1179797.1 hypothetical protein [Listeria monocytogenes]